MGNPVPPLTSKLELAQVVPSIPTVTLQGGMVELVAELLIKQFLPLLFACYNYKVKFKIGRTLSEAYFLEWEGMCYDRTACTIRLDLRRLVTRLYLEGLILGAL